MIGIRADANDKIAMGHIMRCISIAVRLKELGQDVVFIMSQPYGGDFLADRGFGYISLDNDYMDKHGEIESLLKVIQENGIDKLLVDSYQADAAYMKKLKGYIALESDLKLIYMDDMLLEKYPVDMLINYTIGIENGEYDRMGYENTRLLLGSDYIPLRPEFGNEPIDIKDNVENIFITTGGTDEYGMVVGILEALSKGDCKNMKKTVVVGKFFKDDDMVNHMAECYGNIVFHKDVKDICSIMRLCDVAISAGGTTLAELSACGIPTVCFSVADNQLGGVKAYADRDIMYYAGDVRTGTEKIIGNICDRINELMQDKCLRETFSNNARRYVDGQGAIRIAKGIVKL